MDRRSLCCCMSNSESLPKPMTTWSDTFHNENDAPTWRWEAFSRCPLHLVPCCDPDWSPSYWPLLRRFSRMFLRVCALFLLLMYHDALHSRDDCLTSGWLTTPVRFLLMKIHRLILCWTLPQTHSLCRRLLAQMWPNSLWKPTLCTTISFSPLWDMTLWEWVFLEPNELVPMPNNQTVDHWCFLSLPRWY